MSEVEKEAAEIKIFRTAIAWGSVYGPILSKDQWDFMVDRMAKQFYEEHQKLDPKQEWRD